MAWSWLMETGGAWRSPPWTAARAPQPRIRGSGRGVLTGAGYYQDAAALPHVDLETLVELIELPR